MQTAPPLQGLYLVHANPGLRPLRGLHPGLCCVALSALAFLSLTRMPKDIRVLRCMTIVNRLSHPTPERNFFNYSDRLLTAENKSDCAKTTSCAMYPFTGVPSRFHASR